MYFIFQLSLNNYHKLIFFSFVETKSLYIVKNNQEITGQVIELRYKGYLKNSLTNTCF